MTRTKPVIITTEHQQQQQQQQQHSTREVVVHFPRTAEEFLESANANNMNANSNNTATTHRQANQKSPLSQRQQQQLQQLNQQQQDVTFLYSNQGPTQGQAVPLSKRELLMLLERSDLSTNIEIVRIKNELAKLKSSINIREIASPG